MPRVTDVEGRRDQILRAAVKVFGERGYTNATISDIASDAGVAHGTVYLYFRNKAEILQSLHVSFTEWLIADISGPSGPDGDTIGFAGELYRMFRGALDVCSRNRQITEVCLTERAAIEADLAPTLRAMEESVTRRLSERVAQAIAIDEIRPLRPEFAGDLITRLLGVAIRRLLALGPGADADLLAHEMVDFIMFGMVSDNLRNNPMHGRVSSSKEEL